MEGEEKTILLVEDEDDDALLFERAVMASTCAAKVHRVGSTEQAITCLREGVRPRLVFLDLMLPNGGGVDFLRWIREQEDCKCIPVIVWAGVVSAPTMQDLCDLGVNAVMVKPGRLQDLREAIAAACTFWLRHCVPPPGAGDE
jgi:CheY-like chemotaxis protein